MTAYDDYGMPVGAYAEPESLAHQAWRVARAFALYRVKPEVDRRWAGIKRGGWSVRRVLSAVRVLVVVWWVAVYLGERSAIRNAVDACRWENWENWDSDANPHRLVFVADPQLIDPHTYPGRPWPLNDLTIRYVDQYLRRTYSRIQEVLYPDTVFFLGDLFDGGREWSTHTHKNPDQQWARYGDDFWMNEYRRFGRIFFGHWGDGGTEGRPGQPGRKLISSLPGNHDLGFARGVDTSVRDRFHAYFGDGNRIDVVGNHTFVSIDSVSLSALGQSNPQAAEHLWKPTIEFLDNAKSQKRRMVQRELRIQQGLHAYPGFEHKIVEKEELAKAELPHSNEDVTEFPTVLLSHVPLFRLPGTPCGPMREKYPPTPVGKGEEPLEKDNRNAISVSGGYQYQNVLNREITVDIADKVGDIRYAFSGDDHDYCEVLHRAYTSGGGGIREITVKSLSWAMGVRHPGMVMVSMWNPVDKQGNPLSGDASKTLQTHLCLMPDQLGIFIRYAGLFGLTLFVLTIRAALVARGYIRPHQDTESPLLPTSSSSAVNEKAALGSQDPTHSAADGTHSSNSSTASEHAHLHVRNTQARTRSASPAGGYGIPASSLVQQAGYFEPSRSADAEKRREVQARAWGSVSTKSSKKKSIPLFWTELGRSLGTVAVVVLSWYFWLIWRW
ncbi:hypothetical protein BU23DRAFT_558035 [Bimuria novae-zelandiae CBS 107.79]|uniref:Uncharacterized protein n=1 Tax=Bimuria novae-zelandiae CBS 107.79 TaxID=1447943 RepID=A0A6A5UX64_9PLEO|nr:hypothetical protein BU23DRAFT_558035 [Bimuria novae-zelandiae CBS 107.79]